MYLPAYRPAFTGQRTRLSSLFTHLLLPFFFLLASSPLVSTAQTWTVVAGAQHTTPSQVSNQRTSWTVPPGGPWRVRVSVRGGNGASGGSNGTFPGGRGGVFSSEFNLTSGWVLDVVAGSNGLRRDDTPDRSGGGGGSSGVGIRGLGLLILAGGGGGASGRGLNVGTAQDASTLSSGSGSGSGGGGGNGNRTFYLWDGAGGGGINSNGFSNQFAGGGTTFANGGDGGGLGLQNPEGGSKPGIGAPGGGGFTGGGAGARIEPPGTANLAGVSGGGGGGFTGGNAGKVDFFLEVFGYSGQGGTSFLSTLAYNTSAFTWADPNQTGGAVFVEVYNLRYSARGRIIPAAIPDCFVDAYNQLEALYDATGGANWTNKTGWLTDGNLLNWHGLTITSDACNIAALNLKNNNLTGSMPAQFNLPACTSLDLSNNKLTGSFSNLFVPAIQTLNLNNNQFSGTIPDFSVPTLLVFNAAVNQFSGAVPTFINCPNLSDVNLAINQLSGSVPNFVNQSLTKIDLGLNQLTGTLPALSLANLTFLSVFGNQMSGTLPNFNLPVIKTINISNNGFSGGIPNLSPTLTEFRLANNKFIFGDLQGRNWLNTPTLQYAPQATIPQAVNNCVLSVDVGYTPPASQPQTFTWYRNGTRVSSSNSPQFTPTQSGSYVCQAEDYSLTLYYTPDRALVLTSSPVVVTVPTAPTIGAVVQPNCTTPSGTVTLGGLPTSGQWRLNQWDLTGTGSSFTITGLPPTIYTFTVTNSAGCTSPGAVPTTINPQPVTPTTPVINASTQPTCTVATGGIELGGLPDSGAWTIRPGNITGTGTSRLITGLAPGTYTYTVTNSAGCTSPGSPQVTINPQPIPTAPVISGVVQPNCTTPSGTVTLSGLPASGQWQLNQWDLRGTGTTFTITGLPPATYTFTVTNSAGCLSPGSTQVVIDPAIVAGVAVHVTPGGAGLRNGSSWDNALPGTRLQQAIDFPSACGSSVPVWVGAGRYTPSASDRAVSFGLRPGVAVYGGFAGGETSLSQRPAVNPVTGAPSSSTLSGDLGGGRYSSSVVYNVNGLDNTAVLDGFVIADGRADGNITPYGGGIYNNGFGNGIGSRQCNPTIRNCLITNNSALFGGGIANVGININANASPNIIDCVLSNNTASQQGGGMLNSGGGLGASSPNVFNCLFVNNQAPDGGAVYNDAGGNGQCSAQFTNCVFLTNRAGRGGAVFHTNRGGLFTPVLTNCSFSGNVATAGGGALYYDNTILSRLFAGTCNNSVFWNNGGSTAIGTNATPFTFNNCAVEPGAANFGGNSNATLTASPFVSATNLQLVAGSPAVNTGDNAHFAATYVATIGGLNTDILGNPRIVGPSIDAGAYELPGALPVSLLFFNGRMTPAGAVLQWATVREVDNAFFVLERSPDALAYEPIANVPTQTTDGNSTTRQQYSFTDTQPRPGINYYRLTQVDRDGTRTRFRPVALAWEKQGVVLYPNPVGTSGEAVLEPTVVHQGYTLTDAAGRVVLRVSEPGMLSRLSVGSLPAGTYLLMVQTPDGPLRFRLVRL